MDPASRYGPEVLLIFVGSSSDAEECAGAVVALENELQSQLDVARRLNSDIPYTRLKVWCWINDLAPAVGGQASLVTPELDRADIAVFVFKERVGKGTWEELTYIRKQRPTIPTLVFFPEQPPDLDKICELQFAEEWVEMLKKKADLTTNWMDPLTNCVSPLPNYKDRAHLGPVNTNFDKIIG